MKLFTAIALGLTLLASPAMAWEDLTTMNQHIDRTNFVVNDGCSGTLLNEPENHILTAEHCVSRLTVIIEEDEVQPDGTVKKVRRSYRKPLEVSQSTYDNDGNIVGYTTYRADIVRTKKKADLALLEVQGQPLNREATDVLPEAEDLLRGEVVWIVGNPFRLETTVTRGVVSHIKRELPGASGYNNDVKFLQIDAGAAPGNSGGAVYNADGVLVGVLVRGFPNGHLNFAVSLEDIRSFLEAPETTESYPYP